MAGQRGRYSGVDGSLSVLPESVLHDGAGLIRLLQDGGCTGIACSHSTTFDLTLALLHERGLSVPEDYSVLSLGDASSRPCFPVAPTYVSIDRLHWGEAAAELLVGKLQQGASETSHVRLPCEFIIGTSTAPHPGS